MKKLVNYLNPLDYLLLVLLAFIVFSEGVYAMDAQQTAAQTGYIGQIIDFIINYGWRLAAVLGSPLIVFRLVQWYKKINKKIYNRKPHWLLMDVLSFVGVFVLSYVFLFQYSKDPQMLLVSGIIAVFHTSIVKAIFKYAPKNVADAFADGIYVDDKTTVTRTVIGAVVGTRGDERKKPRD